MQSCGFQRRFRKRSGWLWLLRYRRIAGSAAAWLRRCARADPQDAQAERKVLDAALKARTATPPKPAEEILPGVTLEAGRGQITLKGANVTPALLADLRLWLTQRER